MISPTDEDDLDPQEIENAADESPVVTDAPENSSRTEYLTEWDTPPHALGTAAPKVPMEDEVGPVEELINEGLDEADRQQRMAAADPELEP